MKVSKMDADTNIDLNRRQWMQQALLLIGATAVPIDAVFAAPKTRRKRFLAAPYYQLLIALSDTIMPTTDTPGAVAAAVPAKFDGMLRDWASTETKTLIIDALDRLNAAAKAANKTDFAALSVTARTAFLRPYDAAALAKVAPPVNAPKSKPFASRHWVTDNGYLKIKQLIVALYYNSEIAMTQELIYDDVPGEWQPSIKVTKASRPWAATGPF
jgi:gluconate 2-dehydrogenase gamma chain